MATILGVEVSKKDVAFADNGVEKKRTKSSRTIQKSL